MPGVFLFIRFMDKLIIKLDGKIYSKESILKTAHKYSDFSNSDIRSDNDNNYSVTITFNQDSSSVITEKDFIRDLIDNELRNSIANQT